MIHVDESSTGEDFQDALKDPGNRRERDQGDCNGKRDNGLKCTWCINVATTCARMACSYSLIGARFPKLSENRV